MTTQITTADRSYTVVQDGTTEAKYCRQYGRFLASYCYRGHGEEINEPITDSERVVHVDCGEAVNVYAVDTGGSSS